MVYRESTLVGKNEREIWEFRSYFVMHVDYFIKLESTEVFLSEY